MGDPRVRSNFISPSFENSGVNGVIATHLDDLYEGRANEIVVIFSLVPRVMLLTLLVKSGYEKLAEKFMDNETVAAHN